MTWDYLKIPRQQIPTLSKRRCVATTGGGFCKSCLLLSCGDNRSRRRALDAVNTCSVRGPSRPLSPSHTLNKPNLVPAISESCQSCRETIWPGDKSYRLEAVNKWSLYRGCLRSLRFTHSQLLPALILTRYVIKTGFDLKVYYVVILLIQSYIRTRFKSHWPVVSLYPFL